MWYSKGSISPSQQNISVSVTDGTDPLQGVAVKLTLSTDNTKTYTGSTGSAGGCTISNVPTGSYVVEATKQGYEIYTGTLTVTSETSSLVIEMDEADIYSFVSYEDAEGTTEWGEGTVQTTGVTSGDYSQVQVLTNSPDESFVGQKFYVLTAAEPDGTTIYQCYSDAGTTSAGIYVAISPYE